MIFEPQARMIPPLWVADPPVPGREIINILFRIIFEWDSGSKIRPIGIITNLYGPQKAPETNLAHPESRITKEFVACFSIFV